MYKPWTGDQRPCLSRSLGTLKVSLSLHNECLSGTPWIHSDTIPPLSPISEIYRSPISNRISSDLCTNLPLWKVGVGRVEDLPSHRRSVQYFSELEPPSPTKVHPCWCSILPPRGLRCPCHRGHESSADLKREPYMEDYADK